MTDFPHDQDGLPREEVKTVTLHWYGGTAATEQHFGGDTHRITFKLDARGKPDCTSIKMEEL